MRSQFWKAVQLPPLDAWSGIEYYSVSPRGAILIKTDETKTLEIDLSPLRPHCVHRLKADLVVSADAAATPQIFFAEKTVVLAVGEHEQIQLESTLPINPILSISDVNTVTINSLELLIRFPDRSKPLPYDLLGFDLLTPNLPQGFILNKSRIGRAPLGGMTAVEGAFIIGESRLNETRLPIPLPEYSWQDILSPGLTLAFRQGANQGSTLLPVAQVGTAIIEIKDFDPRKAYLRQGLRCRIYHRLTRQIIFTGKLQKFSMRPAKFKHEHDVATLEFTDTVGTLAATKRYGVRTLIPDTLEQRIQKLLAGTGIGWKILDHKPAVPNLLGATVTEANLASYLDMTCATVGGAWWVNHDGSVTINPNTDVQVFYSAPWFIVGKTPLDGGKLPPAGAENLTSPEEEAAVSAKPFTVGESRLDSAYVAANALLPGVEKCFTIGESRLDKAILADYPVNTTWAVLRPGDPPLLTDEKTAEARALYYTDIEPAFDSAEMLGEVAVENHRAIKEEGSWSDHTKTFVASSPAARITYGTNRKTVAALCADDAGAQALANYLLNRPIIADESALEITSVKLNALPISDKTIRLELFSYCQLKFKGVQSDHLVYATENRLTPYTWNERLYLTAARKGKE